MKKLQIIAIAVLFASLQAFSQQTNWNIDKSHTHILFGVKHMVISTVTGYFRIFDGKLVTNGSDFNNAYVELTIDASSVNTDNEQRDNHLKSPDFFDAQKFPKIYFKSKSFRKISDNEYDVVGNLTMKGVTKEITLKVENNGTIKDPYGKTRTGFKLSGKLDRFDYGLTWSKSIETGGLVVGKEIKIDAEVELVKEQNIN
jgi:polyisoprenoid-binding protein YceI